jgi:hypothetical protein
MAESTHALAHATSQSLIKTASTSKLSAYYTTQQQSKLLGAKPLARMAQEGGGWLIANNPSQNGKAVPAIEKITIADTNQLSDS